MSAGTDPLTGRTRRLRETHPEGDEVLVDVGPLGGDAGQVVLGGDGLDELVSPSGGRGR